MTSHSAASSIPYNFYPIYMNQRAQRAQSPLHVPLGNILAKYRRKDLQVMFRLSADDLYPCGSSGTWDELRSLLLEVRKAIKPTSESAGKSNAANQVGGGWTPCWPWDHSLPLTPENAGKITAFIFNVEGDGARKIEGALLGYEFVAYTTSRHSINNPSWIVVMPLSTPMQARLFGTVFDRVNAMFGGTLSKEANEDCVQFFDLPCVPAADAPSFSYLHGTGAWLKVKAIFSEEAVCSAQSSTASSTCSPMQELS